MARKKKKKPIPIRDPLASHVAVQGFYTPFDGLDQHLRGKKADGAEARAAASLPRALLAGGASTGGRKGPAPVAEPRTESPGTREPARPGELSQEDARLFLKAMEGVKPLSDLRGRGIVPTLPRGRHPGFYQEEEEESRRRFLELLNGETEFELFCSDEYVEGAVVGLSPDVLRKLKRGDFSYQAYIDLHGCNRLEARERVVRFLQDCFAVNRRCLLVVPGRGLNSQDKEPVLKTGLVKWLTKAPLKRLVLAFCTARPYDGGPGALYVLLRRNPANADFVTRPERR